MLDFRENPRARGCAANRLFSLFVRFLGLPYYRARTNSLFPHMPFGILGAKTKIAISVFASNCFNNQMRVPKSLFWISALNLPIPRLTERVKLRHYNNMCALKITGSPKNRNARSDVRFLGIRSNKCTRAWRQATRAACPPSPCCDVQRGENRSGFPLKSQKFVLSAQNKFRELPISPPYTGSRRRARSAFSSAKRSESRAVRTLSARSFRKSAKRAPPLRG